MNAVLPAPSFRMAAPVSPCAAAFFRKMHQDALK
jgi:hypothetical protein